MNPLRVFIKAGSFFIFLLLITNNLFGDINKYIYPYSDYPSYSNYGGVGLIQLPTARLQKAGSLAFSWSHNDPYLRGSIVAYPFSWLEASYQYTDVNNALYSNVSAFSGSQSYKDKSFDLKLGILKETQFFPAISIGIRDIAGTGVFSSEYVVATKRISNIDFTTGIGWGTLSRERFSNPLSNLSERFNSRTVLDNTQGGEFNTSYFFRGDIDVFAGAEIYLPNLKGMRLKLEYDTTNYNKEGFPEGRNSFDLAFKGVRKSDSNFNFGLIYPINNSFHLKLGFVKGNTINFGFSFQRNLAQKNPVIKKIDPPISVPNADIIKQVNTDLEDIYLYRTSLIHLGNEKFFLQKASVDKSTYRVVYQQSTHNSFARSVGRAARVLDQIAPDNIRTFEFSNLNAGMGMNTIRLSRSSISQNYKYKNYKLVEKDIEIEDFSYDPNAYKYNPSSNFPSFFYKISPAIRSQLGGPDGFYFGDLRLAIHSETLFSKSINLSTSASIGLYDNFDELKLASDSILPHVRTDIVQYLKQSRSLALTRMQFNYFNKPSKSIYSKISFGILEEMFGGVGVEFLYRPLDSNFALGLEAWDVQQRDYNQGFEFLDYRVTTGHATFYYREPFSRILFKIKGGRYLAKDSGFTFDFSRSFRSGVNIGAFFSLTDISKEEFGEGSFDKGFYFHIPIDIFFSNYRKGNAAWGLRPLTRDGAQSVVHSHHLWGVTEQASSYNFMRDISDIFD